MALTRRTLLALPLAAAAPREPQAGNAIQMASTWLEEPLDAILHVGDILTFGLDPLRYRVVSVCASSAQLRFESGLGEDVALAHHRRPSIEV